MATAKGYELLQSDVLPAGRTSQILDLALESPLWHYNFVSQHLSWSHSEILHPKKI